MWEKILPVVILLAPPLVAMGLVRLIAVAPWWVYLGCAVLAGAASGAFLAAAASAMATANDPGQAKWMGVIYGSGIGLVAWALVFIPRWLLQLLGAGGAS